MANVSYFLFDGDGIDDDDDDDDDDNDDYDDDAAAADDDEKMKYMYYRDHANKNRSIAYSPIFCMQDNGQPHRKGHGQHPHLKMDMDWWMDNSDDGLPLRHTLDTI